VALVLQGCGGAKNAPASFYSPTIQSAFLKSCFAANRDPSQLVRQEAICGCTLKSIEGAYTQSEFLAIDTAMRKGQKAPDKLVGFFRTCVASLTVRAQPS
jgi:hypothetical protein